MALDVIDHAHYQIQTLSFTLSLSHTQKKKELASGF